MVKSYNDPFEHVNYNAIIDGCSGNGVISGLLVSERSAGQNMSVDVATGSCSIGSLYTESSIVNLVISGSHATNARKDIIIYDSSAGNPAVITGIASPEPIPPDITTGDILLAVVNIPAALMIISNSNIEDGRVSVGVVPFGIISMWHGTLATIPPGWHLCDGTSGTPDLRSRFVRGAPSGTNPGATGGSDTHTLTISEMPSHGHNISSNAGGSNVYAMGASYTNQTGGYPSQSVGGSNSHNNMPSYYQIAYIMKL